MAASYEYDETGQFSFFVLTFLLLLLIPFTYSILRPKSGAAQIAKPPCSGWNQKHQQVVKSRSKVPSVSKKHLGLAVGWMLFAYVTYQATFVKQAAATYDPFAILGISTGLDEKAIKRHYKRLSLKFHPDKLKLSENQTAEQANEHFVDLTKAYKSLTDDTIRKNYELYGHPDGKRDTSMGIALPKWIVESQNNAYVIGVYGLAFGLLLPWLVGRWWYGSRKFTKDGCLTPTAAFYFHNLTETTTFTEALEILACSSEFDTPISASAEGKKGGKEMKKLEEEVKRLMVETKGEKGFTFNSKLWTGRRYAKRTGVLLYAHLLRVDIEDVALLKDKQAAVTKAHTLTQGMQSIALSHNWLSTYLLLASLQQHLVQAFHPSLPPLLQLPYITTAAALRAAKEKRVSSVAGFVGLSDQERKELFKVGDEMGEDEMAKCLEVAKMWPQLQLVSSVFKVVGERVVTPGCYIQFTIKLRMRSPGSSLTSKPQPNGTDEVEIESAEAEVVESGANDVKGEEMEIDELIGRKKPGADGEQPVPWAHAPNFPAERKPCYNLLVGDHKLNRIFVQPIRFTSVGASSVRTIRTTFQAPQGAGLYTFQAYIKSDCYVGTDAQASMQLHVEPPEAAEEVGEDDISEPDEDTLAGQMAAMRGQPVKRGGGERGDDSDTSGTESSASDSSTDSDSDSDSD